MILRTIRRVALCVAAAYMTASCSGGERTEGPPSNQGDICAIFAQRPAWRDAVYAAAHRWGAPVPVQMAIIWRESSFRSNVRPPRTTVFGIRTGYASSAYGYAQAIDGTWDWYRDETGNRSADRTDFDDAADFVGWYVAKSAMSNGISPNDAYNQYLAYHEGHAGHRRGSYNAKPWLTDVAARVAGQAAQYRGQLGRCS